MICIVLVSIHLFVMRGQPSALMQTMFFSLLNVGIVLLISSIVCVVISELRILSCVLDSNKRQSVVF